MRPFLILPALASVVVISAGLYFAFGYVTDLAAYLRDALPEWLSFLNAVLEPLLYLLSVLLGAWLFGFCRHGHRFAVSRGPVTQGGPPRP